MTDPRPTVAAPDDDPYLWLEEIASPRALAWVKPQNAATLARFGDARFAADRDALKAILDDTRKIPYVRRRGKHLYNFWQDADHPRGLWRRTSLAEFRKDEPAWEIVADIDALAREEDEDWVFGGAITLPPEHRRAVVSLSRGGGDASVMREFDLREKRFVADGFTLAEAKTDIEWLDENTVLLMSSLGEGMATDAGYARSVRLWRRGEPVEDATVLFEVNARSNLAYAAIDRSQDAETVWFADGVDFFNTKRWIGNRTGPKRRFDIPLDVLFEIHGDWVVLRPREPWALGGKTHLPGTLLGASLAAMLNGEADFVTLFEPTPRRAVEYFAWARGRLVVSVLDNLMPVTEVLTPHGDGWARETVTGLPELGVVNVWRLDERDTDGKGELLANAQDPVTPSTLFLIERGKPPAILKRAPDLFDASKLTVSRHEALATDGERIPYTQVGPGKATGDAPVYLTGYGGYEMPALPHYNPVIGKLWLERGGTSVVANIRGGGEFGPPWHEAGRRDKKWQSHDDFAAVARDLVRRGVTRPERIAAEGASNGGLLVANMLVRYPECFGALFCTIPLTDMRRYSKLLAGASWIAEYGDPDKPEEWDFLRAFSAYHLAESGKRYPPILIATSRADDRVHPGHARKFAMKLQALGYEAYFYEPATGGHGYGKDNSERAAFSALGLTFLAEKIGGFNRD